MKFAAIVTVLLLFLLTSCATPVTTDRPLSDVQPDAHADTDAPVETRADTTTDTAVEKPVPELSVEVQAVSVQTAVVYESVKAAPAADPDSELIRRLSAYSSSDTSREIAFRIFPQDSEVFISVNGRLKKLLVMKQDKDIVFYSSNAGAAVIRAPGYEPLIIELSEVAGSFEAKLERTSGPLTHVGEIPTGYQPKSVRFTPDGKSVFVTNLGDLTALSQYRLEPFSKLRDLQVPEEYRKDFGFVDTVILADRNEIWLSQMTLDTIHVFSLDKGEYLSSIILSGKWPKVLLSSSDESRVYASCWDSDSIVEIDAAAKRELRSFDTSGTPRGMAFSPDGDNLLVAIFSSSGIDRIDLGTGRRLTTYDTAPGRAFAMRHIVHDETRGEYYVTAMGVKRVYRLSENGEWLGWWQVGEKPNTCALSPDGSRLFVSCRGPNNPDFGYLHKGYEFGKIFIINLESGLVEDWIWGRDQPTGLDISPDGRYLAFSDFLSHNLELYRID